MMQSDGVVLSGSAFWDKRALPLFAAIAFTFISLALLARGEALSIAMWPILIGYGFAISLWAWKARFMDAVLDNGNSLTAIRGGRRADISVDQIKSVRVVTGRASCIIISLTAPCAFGWKIYFSPSLSSWPDSPVTRRVRDPARSR